MFIFLACELIVDVVTDGSVDTIEYALDNNIEQLSLHSDMDIELIESDENLLIIDGPKALLDELSFKNNNGHLNLKYNKTGSWMYDKPVIQLRMPSICKINLYADNELFANDTLYTENISIYSDRTGYISVMVNCQSVTTLGKHISNFYISGKTNNLSVTTTFASSFYGNKLIADSIICNIEGSNHQIVNPVQLLQCNIRQTGNVYYVNRPGELQVNTNEKGSGQAIYDSHRQ